MSDINTETKSKQTISQELLAGFFNTNSPLPVEETLEILRQQNVATFASAAIAGTKSITFLFNSYTQAIESQSIEMSILKSMETYIRRGTMTDSKLEELMHKLDEVRVEAMEKFQALVVLGKEMREAGR